MSETAAVDIADDGSIVVAYYDFSRKGVHARRGTVGSSLGPAQRLTSGAFSEVAAALDDAGHATVAYTRISKRRSELVARRATAGGRFGATQLVSGGGPAMGAAGFAQLRLAAAGRTTALAFDRNDADGRIGVAIARASGRFEAAQRPTVGVRDTFRLQPFSPSVAVSRAGDVLLAYDVGFSGDAVHVTQRRAGSASFTRPRVISSLGHGGVAVATLLSDRKPLVAWDDGRGEAYYTTRLDGRRPDLSPPRTTVTLLDGTPARLRATNAFGVRIRCSEACLVTGRATLRTPSGRTIVGAGERIQRAGVSAVKRFEFNPAARAGRARDGSILRVTIDTENGSGAGREKVVQIRLR